MPVYGKPQKEIASRRARNRWKKKEEETKLAGMEHRLSNNRFSVLWRRQCSVLCLRNSSAFIGIRPLQACFLKTFLTSPDGGFVMGQIEINCQLETKLPIWKLAPRRRFEFLHKSNFLVTEAISYARSRE